jgi:hypothetical protein
MNTKFKEGEVVFERVRPQQKLIISRFVNNLYYCKTEEDRNQKELTYFERDLISAMEGQKSQKDT